MVIAWADKIGGVLPPLIEGVYRKVSADRKIGRRTSRVYAGYNVFQIRNLISRTYMYRKDSEERVDRFFFFPFSQCIEYFRKFSTSFEIPSFSFLFIKL